MTEREKHSKAERFDQNYQFAAVDPRDADDVDLPDWWTKQPRTAENPDNSLRGAIRQLPRSTETTVYFEDPQTGEKVQTDKFTGLINPDKINRPGETTDDALWNIPTGEYTPINPAQFLDPLCDSIKDNDLEGTVFGEFTLRRGGGTVQGDIYFDAHSLDLQHIDNDPVMLGLEVGWDFFSQSTAYVQGMGMDTGCTNSLRQLTDQIGVKHVGDVDSRIDFWADVLEKIDAVADTLTQMIIDAEDTEIDISELPFGHKRFYEFLGFPSYLAEIATDDVMSNADDPYQPTMWDLHSGATYAVTHFARGNEQNVEEKNRMANDLLMNPSVAIERVEEEYQEQQAVPDDQQRLDGSGDGSGDQSAGVPEGDAEYQYQRGDLTNLSASLSEKREQYETRENEIKELFNTV